jgi:hypothetical protein
MSAVDGLVLHADYATRLSYYDDWLDAFARSRDFRVTAHNICEGAALPEIRRAIGAHDLVVLLHSTNADTMMYLKPVAEALKDRRGKLLVFVGNELNLPGSPMAEKIAFLRDVEPDFIATQLLAEAGQWLYASCPGARILSTPHALNAAAFRPGPPRDQRPVDIGTRSARYIPYLGDDERNRLFDLFAAHAFDPALKVDIETDSRLAREGWAGFLSRCKGTVSNEAGSWYLEPDDHTMEEIRAWVRRQPGGIVIANDSALRRLGHRLPWFVKAALRALLRRGPVRHEMLVNEALDFAEIHERFFKERARAPVYTKVVSSRHFDAIGTKTCQILIRGRYNDTLVADEHYLALDPDFANLDAVLAAFADDDRNREIVDRAYEHALAEHTLDHRISGLAAAVSAS